MSYFLASSLIMGSEMLFCRGSDLLFEIYALTFLYMDNNYYLIYFKKGLLTIQENYLPKTNEQSGKYELGSSGRISI